MRKTLRVAGVVMAAQGVSGAIDHLAWQPFFGVFLNFVHRFVISRLAVLDGYELFANLILAALGVAVVVIAERLAPDERRAAQ